MTDEEPKWSDVFEQLAEFEIASRTDRYSRSEMRLAIALSAVGLVQAFNWPAWVIARGGHVQKDEVDQLSLFDCVRGMTAIKRVDRVCEGSLTDAVRSGKVRAICSRAYSLSGGIRVPPLPEIQERM
mgnify:CR=1 FL=1